MRVAWTGAWVGGIERGSVAALAGQLLWSLLERDVEVDLYLTGTADSIPERMSAHPRLTVIEEPVRWQRGRLYSRVAPAAFFTSLAARALTQLRLTLRLLANHRRRPYDCIFQFSQTELLLLGPASRWLPPIVVQPSTTAAAELHWHARESAYARVYENTAVHALVRVYLHARTAVQRHQLRQAAMVVAASRAFERSIQADYGVPPERTRLLPHPVDLDYYGSVPRPVREQPRIALVLAARLSVRKGLELVIELSHRIADLAPEVSIYILGARSLWSDYSGHLVEANPEVASFVPPMHATAMTEVYASAEAVLVPSHFEPFSLVTAEALAAGVPVVASDQIGAAEGVDPAVCRVFRAGDADDFERCVRALVDDLRRPGAREELADIARAEARRHFSPEGIGDRLTAILTECVAASARGRRARRSGR